MIRAMLEMHVKPGNEARFEAAWSQVAQLAAAAPGNLRQALLKDPRMPTRFVISSDWESMAAFQAFERSPAQDVATAPLRELRESAQMSIFELAVAYEGPEEVTTAPSSR